jgi:RNA-directed DNA polymerase
MKNSTEKTPDWFRKRRYIHFDEPLAFAKIENLVKNPKAVAAHAFWPLLKFTIETSKIKRDKNTGRLERKTKEREISFAAHVDSHIFGYYCKQLNDLYEEEISNLKLEGVVLAFRSLGKSNIDFAKDAFDEIHTRGDCCAVAFDVTKFFDSIDHNQLKERWKKLLDVKELSLDHFAVFRALTKHASVDRDRVFKSLGISVNNPRSNNRKRICTPLDFRTKVRGQKLVIVNDEKFGIPQGTAISAMLSNLYMIDFDAAAEAFVKNNSGRYMRYCDDILFIMPNGMETKTKEFVKIEIEKLNLQINFDKTECSNFASDIEKSVQNCDRPLQYLGFLFDGQRKIIRSAAFAKFSSRMNQGVNLAKKTMVSRNSIRSKNGSLEQYLYRKKILSRYSHLGQKNFLRYGYRAAKIMESSAIKRQLRPLWGRLMKAIDQ